MLIGGQEQSSDQSLNESLLLLLRKFVGLNTWSNALRESWFFNNWKELSVPVSLSTFLLLGLEVSISGPILIPHRSPRFYLHAMFEL
uniref:Uncharacterized protein n=1 Tax=Oryza brachyantha TaxID=4533 RepID=J3L3Z1_ORYBR